jgi:hypothetical protein
MQVSVMHLLTPSGSRLRYQGVVSAEARLHLMPFPTHSGLAIGLAGLPGVLRHPGTLVGRHRKQEPIPRVVFKHSMDILRYDLEFCSLISRSKLSATSESHPGLYSYHTLGAILCGRSEAMSPLDGFRGHPSFLIAFGL